MTDRPTHGGRWIRDRITGAVAPADGVPAPAPVPPAAEPVILPEPDLPAEPDPIPPAAPARSTRKKRI